MQSPQYNGQNQEISIDTKLLSSLVHVSPILPTMPFVKKENPVLYFVFGYVFLIFSLSWSFLMLTFLKNKDQLF